MKKINLKILTGIILVVESIFREAVVLLYTVGMSVLILNLLVNFLFFNLMRPVETLSVYIWQLNSEGMVFQKPNLFPMSICDNVAYGSRIYGIKNRNILNDIVEKSLKGKYYEMK